MILFRQILSLFLPILLFCGCQQKVYLMPPPVALNMDSRLFDVAPDNTDENLLFTLYATNRTPHNKIDNSRGYSIFPSDTLRFGYVIFSVGDDEMTWDDLYQQSILNKRDNALLLTQKYTRESTIYKKDDPPEQTSDRGEGFFDQINSILANNVDKDLTVYVHGANSNFYRATAQGAQYYHYTGHNSIVLTYSWPSAESLLRYETDVLHAKQSVESFAKMLEILAYQTKAANINILSYSAGARLVAPALAFLSDHFPGKSREEIKKILRIGEVYFAAPDIPFKPFITRYIKFRDIVNRTTINLNNSDSVLLLAAFQDGVSRLGKPDLNELSEKEMEMVIAATQQPSLNVIDLKKSTALKIGRAHDSWYSNSWVSNDLLLLFLFNAPPEDRGLAVYTFENGAKTYYFPDDYDRKITKILLDNRELLAEKILLKGQ